MKIYKLIFATLLLDTFTSCMSKQNEVVGIDFKNITFEKALKQAQKQDKLIFIDFYTEWCGPCKLLAKGPFMDTLVGDFYNKHFISLKLDAEKEGIQPAKKYGVDRYPTLLFVDGEGNVVCRGVGSTQGNNMIGFGETALKSYAEGNHIKQLEAEYEQKKNDETFLKEYIKRAKGLGLKPAKAIDDWLRIQTEIKEDSKEMLQYLLAQSSFLLANGHAWELVGTHYDTYLKLANKMEKMNLSMLKENMLRNTLSVSYRLQSADLMRMFIKKNKEIGKTEYRKKSMDYFELMYLLLSKDVEGFKNETKYYVNNIISPNPVEKVKKADVDMYNSWKEFYEKRTDVSAKAILQNLKEGKQSNEIIAKIVDIAHYYLQYAAEKQDFVSLNDWIRYCNELVPDKYLVENLQANLLYKQGDTADAIALKRKALDNMPLNRKQRVNVEHELTLMEDGKELLKITLKDR